MSGYNTMIGSHFDYYVLDIHEFVRNPEFDNKIFEQPMQNCSNYSSLSNNHMLHTVMMSSQSSVVKANALMIESQN